VSYRYLWRDLPAHLFPPLATIPVKSWTAELTALPLLRPSGQYRAGWRISSGRPARVAFNPAPRHAFVKPPTVARCWAGSGCFSIGLAERTHLNHSPEGRVGRECRPDHYQEVVHHHHQRAHEASRVSRWCDFAIRSAWSAALLSEPSALEGSKTR
jgi:hypothetical protein